MATITELLVVMRGELPELENLQDVNSLPSRQPSTNNVETPTPELPPGELSGKEVPSEIPLPVTPAERNEKREALYESFRKVFIVHVLAPSEREGQDYDIFIYLKRHHDRSLSDVAKAEFFFGEHWGNRIFEGQHEADVIGVRVSAYGSFLCTCLVTFDDGKQASLYRYIDFEMGKVIARLRAE